MMNRLLHCLLLAGLLPVLLPDTAACQAATTTLLPSSSASPNVAPIKALASATMPRWLQQAGLPDWVEAPLHGAGVPATYRWSLRMGPAQTTPPSGR